MRWTSSERPGAVDQRRDGGDDQRSDGDVGHEVAVHDVDVDDSRAGVEHDLELRRRGARSRPRGSTARRAPRSASGACLTSRGWPHDTVGFAWPFYLRRHGASSYHGGLRRPGCAGARRRTRSCRRAAARRAGSVVRADGRTRGTPSRGRRAATPRSRRRGRSPRASRRSQAADGVGQRAAGRDQRAAGGEQPASGRRAAGAWPRAAPAQVGARRQHAETAARGVEEDGVERRHASGRPANVGLHDLDAAAPRRSRLARIAARDRCRCRRR